MGNAVLLQPAENRARLALTIQESTRRIGHPTSRIHHGSVAQRQSRGLITPWLQVRILSDPPHRQPDSNRPRVASIPHLATAKTQFDNLEHLF